MLDTDAHNRIQCKNMSIPNLTAHSKACLNLLLTRFPQFEPFVKSSDYCKGAWYAEIPWLNGWDAVGLCAQTHDGHYGEEFRVDIGNWHTHFGDYVHTGNLDFLNEAFELIDDLLNERQVMVARWIRPSVFVAQLASPNYCPVEIDWEDDVRTIWKRSWHGTYNHEWYREPKQNHV